jgi:hypothetical protein
MIVGSGLGHQGQAREQDLHQLGQVLVVWGVQRGLQLAPAMLNASAGHVTDI